MPNLERICINEQCGNVPDSSNFATKQELAQGLAGKQDTLTAGENIQIAQDGTISATDTTYSNATQSAAGLMSAADKTKLDGINPAELLTCSTVGDCQTIQDMQDDIDGKQDALTAGQNITIQNGTISATDTTYNNATQSQAGLMSAADKTKLDGIDTSTLATKQELNQGLAGKQDVLTAGNNITISNGTISATFTKSELLSILGYTEVAYTMTDCDGTSSEYLVLAKKVSS